jgi:hypothetical protein
METFGAKPDDSVTSCCRLAAEADALVAIVGHRYGWVPDATDGGDGVKSITWLEVQAALANERPVFAFLVDPAADWNHPKEQDQLLEPNADPVKVLSAVRGLQQFKTFLEKRVRDTFTTPDNLQAKVALSLPPWLTDEIRRWDQTSDSQRSGKRSGPFQVEALGDQYVERTALLARARASWLATDAEGLQRVTRAAFHGLPGSGKSVMARAFVHDAAVRRVFRDGVLSATLGRDAPQTVDLTRLQSAWGLALRDKDMPVPAQNSDIARKPSEHCGSAIPSSAW